MKIMLKLKKRMALENAKLKLLKLLCSNYNALCYCFKVFFHNTPWSKVMTVIGPLVPENFLKAFYPYIGVVVILIIWTHFRFLTSIIHTKFDLNRQCDFWEICLDQELIYYLSSWFRYIDCNPMQTSTSMIYTFTTNGWHLRMNLNDHFSTVKVLY